MLVKNFLKRINNSNIDYLFDNKLCKIQFILYKVCGALTIRETDLAYDLLNLWHNSSPIFQECIKDALYYNEWDDGYEDLVAIEEEAPTSRYLKYGEEEYEY